MNTLRIVEGPDRGKSFRLRSFPIGIGRMPDNAIVLRDKAASAYHCRLTKTGDAIAIEDLSSTNGTLVNDKEVSFQDLRSGDRIAVGANRMVIEIGLRRRFRLAPGKGTAGADLALPADSVRLAACSDESILHADRWRHDPAALKAAHRNLRALFRIDRAIMTGEHLEKMLRSVLSNAMQVFVAGRGVVLLRDEAAGEVTPYVKVLRAEARGRSVFRLPVGVVKEVVETGAAVLARLRPRPGAGERSSKSASLVICGPLTSRDGVLGALYLEGVRLKWRSEEEALSLLLAIGRRAGAAVATGRLYHNVQSLFFSSVAAMIGAIQAKDGYTRDHSERVSYYARTIGKELDLDEKELRNLKLAALLHDVGKLGMPDRLLFNEDELTPEEREEVNRHPVDGADILRRIPQLGEITPVVLHHHEAWNGTGYPEGLRGAEIPLLSRILAVADTFDAITTDRPYQKGLGKPEACEVLRRLAGKTLDPSIVGAFLAARARLHEQERRSSRSRAAP